MGGVIRRPPYERDEYGAVYHEYSLASGSQLVIAAEDVRRERTGVHARVRIAASGVLLAYSTFNVERDEDRVRLANSAHKGLSRLDAAAWSASDMKHALDLFAAGLWEAVIGEFSAEEMSGAGGTAEQDFLCRPWVIKGAGTIIYAPPGRGKSFTGMLLAVSMDAGHNVLFDTPRPRRTLYLNLERSRESMRRRLQQVNTCLGLEPARPLLFINARGRSLSDVQDAARRSVREHHVECVVLDSISRSGLGDLNENAPANRIVDLLNGLAPTWVALAHTPRGDESHIYGSVHFDAGIDVAVQQLSQVTDEGRTVGVGLKVTKANDIRRDDRVFTFALEFDDLGLSAVRMARPGEFAEMAAAARPSDIESQAREFLLHYGEATAEEIAREIGRDRSRVSRVLNAARGFTRTRKGRHIFFGVQHLEVIS